MGNNTIGKLMKLLIYKKSKSNYGQTLVELVVVFGLAGILLPALINALVDSRSGKAQQQQRQNAVNQVQEITEEIRSIRENNWNNLTDGTYHIIQSGNSWQLQSGTTVTNGFTQSVVISDVNRDSSGNIVTSPSGTVDPSTKMITTTVSWTAPLSASVQTSEYLT